MIKNERYFPPLPNDRLTQMDTFSRISYLSSRKPYGKKKKNLPDYQEMESNKNQFIKIMRENSIDKIAEKGKAFIFQNYPLTQKITWDCLIDFWLSFVDQINLLMSLPDDIMNMMIKIEEQLIDFFNMKDISKSFVNNTPDEIAQEIKHWALQNPEIKQIPDFYPYLKQKFNINQNDLLSQKFRLKCEQVIGMAFMQTFNERFQNEVNLAKKKLLDTISVDNTKGNIKPKKDYYPHGDALVNEYLCCRVLEILFDKPFPKVRLTKLDGLELDGYNEELNLGFEYQGEQHFYPAFYDTIDSFAKRQMDDEKKKQLCKLHNINLIIIDHKYYWSKYALWKTNNLQRDITNLCNALGFKPPNWRIKIVIRDLLQEYHNITPSGTEFLSEYVCRRIFETIFERPFPKYCNGSQYEIDGFNIDLKLGFEYQGKQHYENVPYFYKNDSEFQSRLKLDREKREFYSKLGFIIIEVPYSIHNGTKDYGGMQSFIISECEKQRFNIPNRDKIIDWKPFITEYNNPLSYIENIKKNCQYWANKNNLKYIPLLKYQCQKNHKPFKLNEGKILDKQGITNRIIFCPICFKEEKTLFSSFYTAYSSPKHINAYSEPYFPEEYWIWRDSVLTETIEINKKSQFLYENDKSLWSDNLHKYFLMWILKPKEFETEKQLRSQFINLFDILPCFHGKLTKKYLHWKRQNDVNPQMNKTPKPNIKKKKKKSIKEETRIMRIMRELREPKPRDTKDRKTDLLS